MLNDKISIFSETLLLILKKKYGQILLLVALSLIGVEILSQFVFAYDFNTDCQFIMNPIFSGLSYNQKSQMCDDVHSIKYIQKNIRLMEPNQHYSTISINSFGFRGDEFVKNKEIGEYRIFVVGSSMIFGLGATSDNTTIPFLLEQKFEKSNFKKVQVINAGIIAADSVSETYLIENILPEYNPDLIIVYEGYNDAWDIPKHDAISGNLESNEKNDLKEFVKNNLGYLSTPKLIYQKTHNYFQIQKVNEKTIMENSELWKNRWKQTCNIIDETPLLIMMQPVLGAGEKHLNEIEQQMLKKDKHQAILSAYISLVQTSYELKPDCQNVYDITNIFDSHEEHIYVTTAHLTDRGNDIIAQKMYEVAFPFVKDFYNKN